LVIKVGSENRIIFDPFSLDLANECLWRGSQVIKLRPKAFAVLNYLLGRPGQLVTKRELLNTVWQKTFVGDGVLKVAIRQLREALDDDQKSPRFIETAHRRGYRFIGQIAESAQVPARDQEIRSTAVSDSLRTPDFAQGVVGRDEALSRMRGWVEKTLRGERQIVFVTGEAGIGKTALVDTFARSIAAARSIRIGRGQCLEQYGTSEAYLPVLEAIGRLCREQGQVVDVLRAHAPMWLLQMPSLVSAADRELLSREVFGATRERMLREMSEALQALTEEVPLVLILEDLHWSDYSTLDLISYLARQRQAAQLMLIGTYRTVELIVSGHPLRAVKQELLAKQQCKELPLEYLSENSVAEYLSVRFPSNRFPAELAGLIHERTEGNPLFMVNAVDFLVAEGRIAEHEKTWGLAVEIEKVEVGVPDSIKQMIEKHVEHLDADKQRTLEAASVAGTEFSSLAVAAGLGEDRAAVEARCEELARQRQFIQDCGVQELPNGEAVTRYGFIHALYQNVLYERVSASRRVQLHRRIGEREEEVGGERAREIAAELAMHFERGRDFERATNYLQQAAVVAQRLYANEDAINLLSRGLALLAQLPRGAKRDAQELNLQLALAPLYRMTKGWTSPEVEQALDRAMELCDKVGDDAQRAQVFYGLESLYVVQARLEKVQLTSDELHRLYQRTHATTPPLEAEIMLTGSRLHLGRIADASDEFERMLTAKDPSQLHHIVEQQGWNYADAVLGRAWHAHALWLLGHPQAALLRAHEGVRLAHDLGQPFNQALAATYLAMLQQLCADEAAARSSSEEALALTTEYKAPYYRAWSAILVSYALACEQPGTPAIDRLRESIAAFKASGARLRLPYFLGLLAQVYGRAGRAEDGLAAVDEGLAASRAHNERWWDAELHRLRGGLLLAGGADEPEAEAAYIRAIVIARTQEARALELRAATSLARLWRTQRRVDDARRLLQDLYSRFTEGFDTRDLREAKALIDELS
jgi:DNA-binding winged helix-turn-helix (wHTH) protein/predicted ATPase